MKTTKLFRTAGAMLLAFALFLSVNVAKSQTLPSSYSTTPYGPAYGTPYNINSTQTPYYYSQYCIFSCELNRYSADQKNIVIRTYSYDYNGSIHPSSAYSNYPISVYIEVRDPQNNPVVYLKCDVPSQNGNVSGPAYYDIPFSGTYPGYTFRIYGLSQGSDSQGRPLYYEARTKNVD